MDNTAHITEITKENVLVRDCIEYKVGKDEFTSLYKFIGLGSSHWGTVVILQAICGATYKIVPYDNYVAEGNYEFVPSILIPGEKDGMDDDV